MVVVKKNKHFLTDPTFILLVAEGFLLLFISLIVNFYAGTYATERASNYVNDLILSNVPVINVDDIFVYGPLVLWFFVTILCLHRLNRIPFVVKSIALFVLTRSVFITLTHMGPFPDHIIIGADPTAWIRKFSFGGDLFFSAHTGLPFLMALIFWQNKFLRKIFVISSVFFGVIVLLGHLHYSIDVLSAFFITYTIFHIAEVLFKKDFEFFNKTV